MLVAISGHIDLRNINNLCCGSTIDLAEESVK